MKFTDSIITDQKRLARAQHLLYARTLLRQIAEQHNRAWRVAIVAGGSPSGEINAIRELMPRSKITAIDINEDCLEAAIDAGADDILFHDLSTTALSSVHKAENRRPRGLEKFDLAHIDLCSNVNSTTKQIARSNRHLVGSFGVYIFTFSYGRDVIEMFTNTSPDISKDIGSWEGPLIFKDRLKEVPEMIRGRLHYLFTPSMLLWLHSVILYQGPRMPMCSALFHIKRPADTPISFIALEPGDFEIQVTEGIDLTRLFDCPQERIEGMRRKHAALKASYTRQKKISPIQPSLV